MAQEPNATTASGSDSGRSSSDGDVTALPPLVPRTLVAGESCMFLPLNTSSGCRPSRSCASCLQTAGCMISAIGKCVSPLDVAYDPMREYRNAIDQELVIMDAAQATSARVRASQSWQFPAGTVRYCDASDATCSACRQNNFWRSNSSFPDSRFCLGDDGACVCVDVCERRWYVADDCTGLPTSAMPGYYLTSENFAERLWRGLLGMILFMAVVLLIMLRKKYVADQVARARREQRERQLEARRARQHVRSRELGVNHLTLSGWETYRRELIDKETAQLASGNEDSKTGESRDDAVSQLADDRELCSPRGDDGVATAYVSMEASDPSHRTSRPTGGPSVASTPNNGVPNRQLLAPLSTTRDHRASV